MNKNEQNQRRSFRKPPPNYFSRSVQIRLLMLVSMFMLVVVMMNEAAKPKNWHWMWGTTPQEKNASNLHDHLVDNTPIDSRLDAMSNRQRQLGDGELIALPSRRQVVLPEFGLGVDKSALERIRDDSIFRPEEQESWFGMFGYLARNKAAQLTKESLGQVGFQQLFRQSEEYRGKLVTVRGDLRLMYYVEAPENSASLEGYYVLWLRPAGGPNFPLVVYCLDVPPGFPPVKETRQRVTTFHEPVELTGFFFKRWAYRAQDGIRTVPLLLAKIPQWQARPKLKKARLPSSTVIVMVVCGLGLLAIVLTLRVYLGWRRHPAAERYRLTTLTQEQQIEKLQKIEAGPDVGTSLQQLADREKAEDLSENKFLL